MILANLTIPLVGAVDTAVIGRLPDARYLAAVAVGATIMNALYWMCGFLRMSATGLTAQAAGAKKHGELAATAVRGVIIALGIGTLVIMTQAPAKELALWLFQASPEVEELAAGYFQIRVWGTPAVLLYLLELGMLFGLQRMRTALGLSLVLSLSNALLDLTFVIGFGWGVNGVAAGTVISEWLAALVGLNVVIRTLARLDCSWPAAAALLERPQLTRLFQISANLIVRTFFVQLPFLLTTALGATLGDLVLAANAVLMLFLYVMAYGLDGFANAAETLAGYAFGQRDPRQLRQASGHCAIWAVMVAALFSACYYFLGEHLIALATTLPDVREAATSYLLWMVALPLVSVWAFMLDGIFIGATRTAELRNAMALAVLIHLLTLWLTLDLLRNHGIWLAMLTFMAARSLILSAMYPKLERQAASTPTAAG